MENIGNFLEGTYAYGCTKNDVFQTVDLYEAQNLPQVCTTLLCTIVVLIKYSLSGGYLEWHPKLLCCLVLTKYGKNSKKSSAGG